MIKSKLVRNVIISIPLLTTNCFGTVKIPKYLERNESPTTKIREINAKNSKNMQSRVHILDNKTRILTDIKKHKEEYEKKLKEEQERLEKERQEEEIRKAEEQKKEPQYEEILVEVSFYCPCSICCDSETYIMANGQQVYYGAIAAPIEIDLGTQLEFDNQIWTVCDRGGYIQSYIDANGETIYRLDIFLPDHQECLERGRYITVAKIIVDK